MVFEDGDSGHAQVNVLAGNPFCLGGDGDFDGVFGENCDASFLADKPGEAEGIGPVEVEDADNIGGGPDCDGGPQIGPGCEIVLAVPEEHGGVDDGDRNVGGNEDFVGVGAEKGERVEAKDDQGDQCGDSGAVDVLAIDQGLEYSQSSLIPYWGNVEWDGVNQAKEQADVCCPSV